MTDRPDFEKLKKNLASLRASFAEIEPDVHDVAWVQAKLSLMFETDCHMRNFMGDFYAAGGPRNPQEARDLMAFGAALDQDNTRDLKNILHTYGWVRISTFGAEADRHAFLIVQHADHDRGFQKDVLARLETLYPQGETNPVHYAYLFDRVADGPQRYGTQGSHTAQGRWEPHAVEAPHQLNERRAAIGLEPMAAYQQRCALPAASAFKPSR